MSMSLIWKDGKEILVDTASLNLPTEAPPQIVIPIQILKAHIWSRCSDTEYDQIHIAVSKLSKRMQAIFADSAYINTTDEIYQPLFEEVKKLLSETRAIELLQP